MNTTVSILNVTSIAATTSLRQYLANWIQNPRGCACTIGIALDNAANYGVDILKVLCDWPQPLPPKVLIAHFRHLQAKKSSDPWAYLLWALGKDDIKAEARAKLLNDVQYTLQNKQTLERNQEARETIKGLALKVLSETKKRAYPVEVVIIAAFWVQYSSNIKTLLDLPYTYGDSKEHIALPFLRERARSHNEVNSWMDESQKLSPGQFDILLSVLAEALTDEGTKLTDRKIMAISMINKLLYLATRDYWRTVNAFWVKWGAPLSQFFEQFPDLDLTALVIRFVECLKAKREYTSVRLEAQALLACFGADQNAFERLWTTLNDNEMELESADWENVVKKLVKACYRERKSLRKEDNSLFRLVRALRESPKSRICMFLGKQRKAVIWGLFDEKIRTVHVTRDHLPQNDDPRAVKYLLGFFAKYWDPQGLDIQKVELRKEITDIDLAQDPTNGQVGYEAAFRLRDQTQLPQELRAMILVRILHGNMNSNSQLSADSLILNFGGARNSLRLIEILASKEPWQAMVIEVATTYGYHFCPLS